MKKIRAYSLLELIAVMIISTITIAMAYQGYLLFYRQFTMFTNTTKKNSTLTQLDRLLYTDFKACKEVRKTVDGITCKYKNREIIYQLSNDYIIRKQLAVIDTFSIEVNDLRYKKNEGEVQLNDLVNELSFTGNKNLRFIVSKEYGADLLMNIQNKGNY